MSTVEIATLSVFRTQLKRKKKKRKKERNKTKRMVKVIYTEYDFYLFHFHQAPGVFLSISLASRTGGKNISTK